MAFGFGVSDIIKGLELCAEFKDRCLTDANRVDVQYGELNRDVNLLEDRLIRLKSVFSKVSSRTNEFPLPSLPDEDEDAQRSLKLLKKESEELVGDFKATLTECNNFLKENKKYGTRRATAPDNFFNGRGFQSRVNSLRSRILFHMHKIDLIIAPVQLELLTIIHDRVVEAVDRLNEVLDILRAQVGQTRGASATLPEVPASLAIRFETALQKNRPNSYLEADRIPLKEGFDALYRHYRDSTLQFKNAESSPQTLEQYLNLLKAHWLLETLKRSKSFSETRPGSLYRQAIALIEQRIASQYARSSESVPESERVTRFGEQELGGLEDAAFAIWRAQPKAARRIPTQANELEEEMLRLSLPEQDGYQNRELIFFRVHPNVIRLVETKTINEPAPEITNNQYWINVHEDGLVPWYTIGQPNPESGKLRIELTNSRGAGPLLYELQSLKDVLKFQRAVTGYLVGPPPAQQVRCSYNVLKAKRFGFLGGLGSFEQIDGLGSVQIWNHSPLPAASNQSQSPLLSQTSSDRRESVPSGIARSKHPTLTESLGGTTISVTQETSTRTVIAPIVNFPSALVAFTVSKGIYTIWFTELISGMTVTEIRRENFRIVIKYKSNHSTEKNFTTRKISVPENRLGEWNLAVFGQPRHPLFNDQNVVKELSCDFLSLRFTSAERMDTFVNHLNFALKNEQRRSSIVRHADTVAKYQANRPNHTASPTGLDTRRARPLPRSETWNSKSNTPALSGSSRSRTGDLPSGERFGPFTSQNGLALDELPEYGEDISGEEDGFHARRGYAS